MKRRGSRSPGDADAPVAAKARSRAPSHTRRVPDFWGELYWFTVICLCGWILALGVLPPPMVRLREALEFETRCRERVEALSVRGAALGRVMNAFETDSGYREEVMRTILGVKKQGEVFLK